MKHLRTFENFDSLEQIDEVFGFSEKEKEEKLRKEYKKYALAWSRSGIKPLSEEELEAEMAKAKSDKYAGVWGNKDNKMMYKPSKDVKWAGGLGGPDHFGGK